MDCIIKTATSEYIPVDYKNMASDKGGVWKDHKYQLVAYGLLIEETFNTVVKRGFVNYIPETLILRLEVAPMKKSYVKRVLGHIKNHKGRENCPPYEWKKEMHRRMRTARANSNQRPKNGVYSSPHIYPASPYKK